MRGGVLFFMALPGYGSVKVFCRRVGYSGQPVGTAEPWVGNACEDLVPVSHPRTMLLRDLAVHRELGLRPELIAAIVSGQQHAWLELIML